MLKGLTVSAAVKASGGKYFGSEEILGENISTVETDSRKCVSGSLFIAIKGERSDGHDYTAAAAENGAICAVAERPIVGAAYILVENSVAALQRIAAFYRQSLNVKVIGITGSVGKTTCKEVTASVLSQKYRTLKTKGNFNNGIGLPLTILSMTEETQAAVIEMGMSGYGEMELLSSIARPDICVITNIGHSHMENLGSQEGILKAKSEIFLHMRDDAPALLNGDDRLLRTIRRSGVRYFGTGEGGFPYGEKDILLTNYRSKGFEGSEGSFKTNGREIKWETSIPGEHIVYAAAAAAGVGLLTGLTDEEISQGIKAASTIDGRVNIINRGKTKIIDDCYNAAPASMKAGIDLLTCDRSQNTAAVFGDMGELGSSAPRLHYEVGVYAAEKGVGVVIAVGELAKSIYDGCMAAGGRALYFPAKEDFLSHIDEALPDEGTILVKASHFMNFSEIVNFLSEFRH